MAEFNTLNDLIRFNDKNVQDFGIRNFYSAAPLIQVLPADLASNGIVDIYTRVTSDPEVSFRTINHGAIESIGQSETVQAALQILAESATVDKAEADRFPGGPEAQIKKAVDGKLRSGLAKCEKQLLYGTSGADAAGFSGLADMDQYKYLTKTNVNTMTVNGGGTTNLTDIWIIVADEQNVQLVLGQDGIVKVDDSVVVRAIQTADGNTNLAKVFPAYFTPVEGWVGVRIGTYTSAVRIVNVDADAHGANDLLIAQAFQKLAEVGKTPTHVVMNARSQYQIQKSRSAVSLLGALAPLPKETEGVQYIITPNIPNNVTAVAAAA